MRIVYFFLSDFCVDFCPILCTIFVCFFLFNFLCDFCKLYIVLMHELIFFLIGLRLYIYETENIGEKHIPSFPLYYSFKSLQECMKRRQQFEFCFEKHSNPSTQLSTPHKLHMLFIMVSTLTNMNQSFQKCALFYPYVGTGCPIQIDRYILCFVNKNHKGQVSMYTPKNISITV